MNEEYHKISGMSLYYSILNNVRVYLRSAEYRDSLARRVDACDRALVSFVHAMVGFEVSQTDSQRE